MRRVSLPLSTTIGTSGRPAVCRAAAFLAAFVMTGALMTGIVAAQTVDLEIAVTGPGGVPVGGFRWLVEEDPTFEIVPNVSCMGPDTSNCLAVNFHRSYAPVVKAGDSSNPVVTLPAGRRHVVSVLPDAGYTNGGALVAAGQTNVTVVVQPMPVKTAQIRILAFHDNFPINNAPDTPEEPGLEGFAVLLSEAGGRYGHSGGVVSQDAFGNPLGTTYDTDGSVLTPGPGELRTGPDGVLVIKNLVPAKYGIQIVPPAGSGWVQTATIEGTKTIDAWVKSGEPTFFSEFGPPGPHVFVGFVRQFRDPALSGGATIRGQIRNLHPSRPPEIAFYTGAPTPTCWVGLNAGAGGVGRGLYAAPCNDDSTFEITGVPAGSYGLAIWDSNLDVIFANLGVTVTADGNGVPQDVNLLDIPVFNWFARLESNVFLDADEDGFPDPEEMGIPEVAVNLRFRDGSIYQSFPTDSAGYVPFDEVFPFFHWLVAEIDFARLKATGATLVVDAGGPVDPDQGWDHPSIDKLNPQPQCASFDPLTGDCVAGSEIINPNTGNNLSRTETGPVLLEGFQAFLGSTLRIDWGKAAYGPGENGGVSGIVRYAITRAENDPRYQAAENWEPGIPRVQVSLYRDANMNGIIDDLGDADLVPTLADVDNPPLDWRDTANPPGDEDVDRNDNGIFDPGDAIQIVTTDSWDDNPPTGCQGPPFVFKPTPGDPGQAIDCYDGLRNFNQIRPALFDGGYAFTSYVPGGMASGGAEVDGLPSGVYIVEAARPPGYEILKEEDRNVDFGLEYTPDPLLLPPVCVGDLHLVPDDFSLFPIPDDAPYRAGSWTPLCDRKQVTVKQGLNTAADFALFTYAPISANVTGFILDDLSNEFDPNSPNFGEKYSPPFLPISFRDFTGLEIARVYSDRWGRYNVRVPSTYSANIPMPSGMSPNMLIACMNAPGMIPNPVPGGPATIPDPYFNRLYSQFCYTFQYMPGTTTYLDTPVIPIAAFAGSNQYPVDCEFADGTPVIYSVSGPTGGPYVSATGQVITIVSAGLTQVPNPLYSPDNGQPPTIARDYGFGPGGTVTIGGVSLQGVVWSNEVITGTVTAGTVTGQLMITRSDTGRSTETGLTVTVRAAGDTYGVHHVQPSPIGWPDTPIQDAIDAALPGDLIVLAPGVYEELAILWKPLRLQGWGAASVTLNAVKAPAEKLQQWRDKVQNLIASGAVDILPGQEIGFAQPEPDTLFTEEGPGIAVLARDPANAPNLAAGRFVSAPNNARIDGIGITGADNGGGIFVNGYANFLEISNNRIFGNYGTFGGGIRIGHPYLVLNDAYDDSQNNDVSIHHNQVIQNGGGGGAGGGISLSHGSDNYRVVRNYVCGNFSGGEGGGIGHLGLSSAVTGSANQLTTFGLIENNTILFNQSFNQGTQVHGGGIFVGGAPPLGAATGVSEGSGNVKINANLIQGNLAGAGDGGGIRCAFTNGQDVLDTPGGGPGGANNNDRQAWYRIDITNNIIVDNVSGLAGGGISLQDCVNVRIINNTIAHNDTTGTAGEAFPPNSPNQSVSQAAGVVSRIHSLNLRNAWTGGNQTIRERYALYSNPDPFTNNVIWHNRKFYFQIDPLDDPPSFGLVPDIGAGDPAVYDDLAVIGTPQPRYLNPLYSIMSETTDASRYDLTNRYVDPLFVASYFNDSREPTLVIGEPGSGILVAVAFDEGGNFIDLRYGPLTPRNPATGVLYGDYHLSPGSPAIDTGTRAPLDLTAPPGGGNALRYPKLRFDFDGQPRPNPDTGLVDRGADERY